MSPKEIATWILSLKASRHLFVNPDTGITHSPSYVHDCEKRGKKPLKAQLNHPKASEKADTPLSYSFEGWCFHTALLQSLCCAVFASKLVCFYTEDRTYLASVVTFTMWKRSCRPQGSWWLLQIQTLAVSTNICPLRKRGLTNVEHLENGIHLIAFWHWVSLLLLRPARMFLGRTLLVISKLIAIVGQCPSLLLSSAILICFTSVFPSETHHGCRASCDVYEK